MRFLGRRSLGSKSKEMANDKIRVCVPKLILTV